MGALRFAMAGTLAGLAAVGGGWIASEYVGTGAAEVVAAALVGALCGIGVQLGLWGARGERSAVWPGALAALAGVLGVTIAAWPDLARAWLDALVAAAAGWLWLPPRRRRGRVSADERPRRS